uniref:Uncharacterized protein n=1 Tax=Cannabis sativa TaxID=3483 RepID=A0A803Q4N8_CANSA
MFRFHMTIQFYELPIHNGYTTATAEREENVSVASGDPLKNVNQPEELHQDNPNGKDDQNEYYKDERVEYYDKDDEEDYNLSKDPEVARLKQLVLDEEAKMAE